MKILNDEYKLIKEGKGNKNLFMSQARRLFPNLVNQYTSYGDCVKILKGKRILNEAISEVKPQLEEDWMKSFKENLGKELKDLMPNTYNFRDNKNINNLNGQSVLTGFIAEMYKAKNKEKSVGEIIDIVAKNLQKDPLFYVKDGQFGLEGVGYQESPKTKEVKGKYKSSGAEVVKLNENKKSLKELFRIKEENPIIYNPEQGDEVHLSISKHFNGEFITYSLFNLTKNASIKPEFDNVEDLMKFINQKGLTLKNPEKLNLQESHMDFSSDESTDSLFPEGKKEKWKNYILKEASIVAYFIPKLKQAYKTGNWEGIKEEILEKFKPFYTSPEWKYQAPKWEYFEDWILNQNFSSLSINSSGSFFTAFTDVDHIYGESEKYGLSEEEIQDLVMQVKQIHKKPNESSSLLELYGLKELDKGMEEDNQDIDMAADILLQLHYVDKIMEVVETTDESGYSQLVSLILGDQIPEEEIEDGGEEITARIQNVLDKYSLKELKKLYQILEDKGLVGPISINESSCSCGCGGKCGLSENKWGTIFTLKVFEEGQWNLLDRSDNKEDLIITAKEDFMNDNNVDFDDIPLDEEGLPLKTNGIEYKIEEEQDYEIENDNDNMDDDDDDMDPSGGYGLHSHI